MLIEKLRLEAPHLYKLIKGKLIGNEGVPDSNGNAVGGFVRAAELQYNAEKGSYWFREMRPDDVFVGMTAQIYWCEFTTVAVEELLASAATQTVPTRESIACFGWYCSIDLNSDGYLQILKHNVVKHEMPARIAWRQKNPDHFFVETDRILHGVENETFNFRAYNGYGHSVNGIILPILFRIAPRAALNLEKVPR